MIHPLTITQSENDFKKFTDEEIAEFGKDVLYPQTIKLTDPKEIEEAKLLSQELTQDEFLRLN